MLKKAIPYFDELSASKKLLIFEELWDAIALELSAVPMQDWQRSELEKRYEEYTRNPFEGSPWPEVRERLLNALR
ncbi:MAG: addiction module protein [Chthoniobacteraceae bacterium]